VLGVAIVVLVIGHDRGAPLLGAFESAAHGALAGDATIQIITLDADPPDEESSARASAVDGVVELSWTADGSKARIHCYLSREHRWLDREISFGTGDPASTREASERGRLLGFAVATMFSEAPEPAPNRTPTAAAAPELPAPAASQPAKPIADFRRSLEFAGQISSGVQGTAAGFGAAAALRVSLHGPVWARLFVSGRTGNIAPAQATTQNALFGGGVALTMPLGRFQLGARSDLFANYFAATHLSEDDVHPDRRTRWLPGADLLGEAGFHLTGSAVVFAGAGIEAVLGKTEIYTHGQRVAVVAPLRVVGEFGFRIGF
jgi:hypothetical protein